MLDRLFGHFVSDDGDPRGLIGIFEQAWFHQQLIGVDILRWFPLVVLYRPEHTSTILEALVDQATLSQGFEDINIPLECLYRCLIVISSENYIARHIGEALSWAMGCAERARDSQIGQDPAGASYTPRLVTFERRVVQRDRIDMSQIEPRTFDFVTNLSEEEWKEWITRMKTLKLGTQLGGLGYGPRYSRDRYSRDPNGTCLYGASG
jgi:hypothetical protein